ncbi:class I SAM-dependent DNA methyltransferase [Duganella aceris]|jgi:SAM-dependent methyltransferase|uniref:Methyltransferase domain-containing protein n=1 Tax=Duganella aceris TaxID=2703883 RepID=A0ABX0FSR6_9BURK|nr:class I SAM-dependent methyltransferase [Duganella aceris]NGZ87730.1 methyltransferase domain-containing protein [Duganella aceris]
MENQHIDEITQTTLRHYENTAEQFFAGTIDHDVSQNIAALLDAIDAPAPYRLLDLGCGPGRDLKTFKDMGHEPIGVDGAARFVEMARAYSGCEAWQQDFVHLDLPADYFDGIYANASLFHVPGAALPKVLRDLHAALKTGGVLFSSNPRGDNREGWNGPRYGNYHDYEAWERYLTAAGFIPVQHYYRPAGLPRDQQPWLASVWRKI